MTFENSIESLVVQTRIFHFIDVTNLANFNQGYCTSFRMPCYSAMNAVMQLIREFNQSITMLWFDFNFSVSSERRRSIET